MVEHVVYNMAAVHRRSVFVGFRLMVVAGNVVRQLSSSTAATSPVVSQEAPNRVPNALSCTVLVNGEDYSQSCSQEMLPPSRKREEAFLASEQAGREAANYVFRRWPAVAGSKRRTALVSGGNSARLKAKGVSETSLRYLIDKRRTGRAMKMYLKMKEKGVSVSLDTQNGLLDLLTFYGVGNPWVERSKNKTHQQENSVSSEETGGNDIRGKVTMRRAWREDCVGHQFFTEMQEKDTRSYETLITGMVKFGAAGRALRVFKEMQAVGLQPSVETYNLLLGVVKDLEPAASVCKEKTMKLLRCMSCGKPPVKPNAGTLTVLLKTCHRLRRELTSLPMQIMRELMDVGVEPTLMSYSALLEVCIASEQLGVLYTVMDHLEHDPMPLKQAIDEDDVAFFPQAARVALKLEDTSLVDRLYSLYLLSHESVSGNPAFFFVRLLKLSALHSDIHLLLHYYNLFVPHTFIPSSYTYTTLLQACGRHQASIEATSLWRDISAFGVHHSPQLLDAALTAISSHIPMEFHLHGDLVKSICSVIDVMRQHGVVPPRSRLGTVLFAFMQLLPLEDVLQFVQDCVSFGWLFSYPSICSLLEERIVAGDVEHCFVVLRAMAKSQQLPKMHHLMGMEKHMRSRLTIQQLEELKQYGDMPSGQK